MKNLLFILIIIVTMVITTLLNVWSVNGVEHIMNNNEHIIYVNVSHNIYKYYNTLFKIIDKIDNKNTYQVDCD